jgi:type IV secretory pathway VirD2 relaxase
LRPRRQPYGDGGTDRPVARRGDQSPGRASWHEAHAPFRHLAYLRRDGVTKDGEQARMFGAESGDVDHKAFAERCEGDRHHFRFIVAPDDAAELSDIKAFTRDLMADAERDLGTRLEWVAVDHWNTEHPHIHVIIRGRTGDGEDLVISRDYIAKECGLARSSC